MPRKKALTQAAPVVSTFELLKHNNHRLFSDHFLDTTLMSEPEWLTLQTEAAPVMEKLKQRYATFGAVAARTKEAQTEHDWVRPMLADLGHTFEVQATLKMPAQASSQFPDYVFYATEEQRLAQVGQVRDDRVSQAGALAVGDAKEWALPLDQTGKGASVSFSNKNPSFQIFFYMLHSKLPWGILTNGRKWRLYRQDTAYKLDVYYEIDLPDLLASDDIERFLYFYAFFRRTAFTTTNPLSLDKMLKESVTSSKQIRDDLKGQIYEALHLVAQGFLTYPDNKLEPTPENCQRIYKHSLILLYRLLFILYAESRDLLPTDNTTYEAHYSLHSIANRNGHPRALPTQMSAQSHCGFSSQCKAHLCQCFFTAGGSPGIHTGQIRESFRKNFAEAGFVFATETADHDQEPQRFPSTRQIGQGPCGVTMNTMRNLLATRAGSFACFYRQGHEECIWCDLDLIQPQVSRQTEEMGWLDHGLG
ncbi:MAG TPA: hypothetical protein VFV38_04895 [Ktedonobacteraceae bacterium]|nr:hypothetical protein [Ktedonobacteraceae bacterium]